MSGRPFESWFKGHMLHRVEKRPCKTCLLTQMRSAEELGAGARRQKRQHLEDNKKGRKVEVQQCTHQWKSKILKRK